MNINEELQLEQRKRQSAEAQVKELQQQLSQLREQNSSCESSLLENEKMASLGLLTAGIAHEINNPVGYIISNVNTLGDYLPDIQSLLTELRRLMQEIPGNSILSAQRDLLEQTARTKDIDYVLTDTNNLLEETLEGAQRVLSIVRGLKEYAYDDDEEFQLGNINDCITTTLNLVNNELKYSCNIETRLGELPDTYFNSGKLGQVFVNLLVNAGHAIEDQGNIVVTSEYKRNLLKIRVQDDGCGMEPQLLKKIFEPFYTTKPRGQGTGLGLSISRGIVEEHGGNLTARSRVGEGTQFTVTLPLIESPPLADNGIGGKNAS